MPEWRTDIRARLAHLDLPPAREAEIIDELAQHLEDHYRELLAGGVDPVEAERLARSDFQAGNVLAKYIAALKLAHPPVAITPGAPSSRPFGGLWQDLRYAARMLRNNAAFTATAVLTLALGIGANAAIFALVDATLLRPLPLPSPDRLVSVYETTAQTQRSYVSGANLNDWNEQLRTFERIAAFAPNVASMVLGSEGGVPETVPRQWVTAGIFDVLGLQPIAGRVFSDEDDRSRASVVVLNERFWRERYNADPGIIDTPIRLDGEMWTVVGVVPETTDVIGRSSIWALRPLLGAPPRVRAVYNLRAIGRLRPGIDLDTARADITRVAATLATEYPATNTGRGAALEPLRDTVIGGDLRQTSILFLSVVAFVLLICCANVANLLLARAAARRREFALRSALGADRRRVIRQLLTESLALSLTGGVLGLGLGAVILQVAPAVIPPGLLPPTLTLSLDLRVVVFCAVTAVFVGLLFGLAPAWQATDFAAARTIASSSRSTTARGSGLRSVLVAGQVATAVALLVGAGLLLRSLVAVENVDRGYRADQVLTMMVDPPGMPSLVQFYDTVEKEVMAVPGVASVGWATTLPLGESYLGSVPFSVVGDPPAAQGREPEADYQIVSASYFRALDLPIVAGRAFDDRDIDGRVPVAIVNEAFVERYLPGRDPIGQRIGIVQYWIEGRPAMMREIVGVARQVKGSVDEREPMLQIYVPLAQEPMGDIFMMVRASAGDAAALTSGVRAAIARVDTAQLVSVRSIMTLDDVLAQGTSRHRFRATLVIAFAALALALAMVGLFGVLAYTVQQRSREFGLRRALGATTRDVLRQVARAALPMIVAGAAAGLALAVVLGQLIASMLVGVQPVDVATYIGVVVLVGLTAAASMASPAWRATRVDPAIALRSE